MLKNYLIIAIRNLLKHKAYSFINIAGLAIGMACCILILLYVQDELSYDRYHEKADQIYRFVIDYETKGKVFPNSLSSAPMGPQLVDDFPDIISFVRFYPRDEDVLVGYEDKRFYEKRFFYADASVFEMFTFQLVEGDPQTALTDPYSVVITKAMAEKYFGNEDPVGKILKVENSQDYKITGVMQNVPRNSHFRFDFLSSFKTLDDMIGQSSLNNWTNNPFYTYLLLPNGYETATFEAKFPAFIETHMGEILKWVGWKLRPWLQPLTDIHLHPLGNEIERGSDIRYVYIFSTIAFFILLIACINFMNLATARSTTRAKEVGLRKVIGANRNQLTVQFLGESILLSFISLFIAIVLVELLLPRFNLLVGKELGLNYTQNIIMLAGLIGITLFVGIVSGSYPAFFLSSFQPIQVLKGLVSVVKSYSRMPLHFRKAFVVLQFSISIILIISTVIVFNQLNYMKNKKLGLNEEHVVVIPLRAKEILNKYESFRNEFLENPNVLSVTLSNRPPGTGAAGTSVYKEGESPDKVESMKYLMVDHDFINTLEIELAAGRNFSQEFVTDASEAFILNEQAVQDLEWSSPEEAIGQRIVWAGQIHGPVIGVVKNFHFQPLHIFMQPLVLKIYPRGFQYLLVRIAPVDIPGTLDYLRDNWNEFTPGWPFVYSFLDEDYDKLYHSDERFGKIFGNFTFLAIFIACLGLFGLAAFSAEQRTKEIGIRKVLGASVTNIANLLSIDFIKLVLIAHLIAWPSAYYAMSKWLQDFSFRINISIWVFLLAAALAVVIAWLTVSYQAIKAALSNPVEALRYE